LAKKRREISEEEWCEIERLEDNQKLTTNELLRMYRKETKPVVETPAVEDPQITQEIASDNASATNPCSSQVQELHQEAVSKPNK